MTMAVTRVPPRRSKTSASLQQHGPPRSFSTRCTAQLSREIAHLINLIGHDATDARQRLDSLIGRARIGLRLLSGWKVVIAGRPNVGKSRLLNALCGFSRAIVDSTPGTTRDLIAFQTALAGWPVELVDTAGLRATNHAIERLGIQLAQGELGTADLVLLVLDRSQQLRPIDRQLIAITANAARDREQIGPAASLGRSR